MHCHSFGDKIEIDFAEYIDMRIENGDQLLEMSENTNEIPKQYMMTTFCMAFHLNTNRLLRYYFPYLMKISLQISSLSFFSPIELFILV